VRILKTILASTAVLLAISCAASARGAETNPLATRRGFEVGGRLAHYHYEEHDFAKFIGNRGGFVGAYTFPPRWNRVFFRVDGRGSYGSLKYQGSGTQDSVPDLIVETRGVAGLDFSNIKDSDVQPIGLGAAGLEPANWTRESGIEFRYRF